MGHWVSDETSIKALIKIEHNSVFDHIGDTMPPGRIKWIYRVGVVAEALYLSAPNHPFTGLFKGGDFCMVRLASLLKPSPKDPSLMPMTALKCFRDGMNSGNLFS
jgi:hypothetical protein